MSGNSSSSSNVSQIVSELGKGIELKTVQCTAFQTKFETTFETSILKLFRFQTQVWMFVGMIVSFVRLLIKSRY